MLVIGPKQDGAAVAAMLDYEWADGHLESPIRLSAAMLALRECPFLTDTPQKVKFSDDRIAAYDEIGIAHSSVFVEALRNMEESGVVSSGSFPNVTSCVHAFCSACFIFLRISIDFYRYYLLNYSFFLDHFYYSLLPCLYAL